MIFCNFSLEMKKFTFLILCSFTLILINYSFSKSYDFNRIYLRFNSGIDKQEISYFFKSQKVVYEQLLRFEQSISYKFLNNKVIEPRLLQNLTEILRCEEILFRTYEIKLSEKIDPFKFCKRILQTHPEIEIAEPIYPDFPLSIPNDTYASQQTMLSTIKAFQTWDTFIGDTNIIIGIVDTGVLQEHEDLQNSIATNWNEIPDNGIDDDQNGYVDDFRGCNLSFPKESNGGFTYHQQEHGTAVAGIAGATTNNGKGIAGVAYKCRIFPVKASDRNSNLIDYGYRGILYCAIRGFHVVNCSWGRIKPFSPIDQSIIDYAVARGTVVVAAGGNGDNSPYVWYPAGYRGVLAVGEVNQVDIVTSVTTLNHTIRIMAPGIGNWVTKNQPNLYDSPNYGGTSWAAPVVSGVIAMVRARYPWLDPLQTIEYCRQIGDDISNLNSNPFYRRLIPLRVNMLKMLSVDPMSIPGISPIKVTTKLSDGKFSERFFVGDTVFLTIEAKNYLASAQNLRFVLSLADDFETSLKIIDDEANVDLISSGENFHIGEFSFKIEEKKEDLLFLRVDILGENGYNDFFLIPFIPTIPIKNFQNDSIFVSFSDKGSIGFYGSGNNRIGNGFGSKSFGNQLYKGGLIISENDQKLVSALFSFNQDGSDFRVVKPFAPPEENVNIIDDYLATELERIGIQVTQNIDFKMGGFDYFKIFFSVRNISNRVLNNVSLGYILDFDVGEDLDSNFTFVEPIYSFDSSSLLGAVQYVASKDSNLYVAVGVRAYDTSSPFLIQSAGLDSQILSFFNKDTLINVMKSNTYLQFNGVSDISVFSGIRFAGDFPPNEERKFTMLFAVGRSKERLKQISSKEFGYLDVEKFYGDDFFVVYPNPVDCSFYAKFSDKITIAKIEIYNALLQKVVEKEINNLNCIEISSSKLPPGFYLVKLITQNKIFNTHFIKF